MKKGGREMGKKKWGVISIMNYPFLFSLLEIKILIGLLSFVHLINELI
jgi:hypothetical protein